ncbi:MAG TPA: hypothetical protein VEF03_00835, partial [Candidatus Binataceae bacterium]|nr:hypothetical protein [Candidatus Binataceae bacterium]
MTTRELFDAAERIKRNVNEIVARYARSHRDIVYADLRFETVFNRSASATNGESRESAETESAGFAVTIHAGVGGALGHGQIGVEIGRVALDERRLKAAIADAFANARTRALASAREKKALIRVLGARARSLAHQGFPPRAAIRDEVEATFGEDPRTVDLKKIEGLALRSSRAIGSLGDGIAFNAVSAMSELRHEIFANTEGSLISQRCAFSQGDTYVVAQASDGHQEIYDTIGQQRGFEALEEGWRSELLSNESLENFSLDLAREALELAGAPVLKPPDGEVVVVTDPHFNALVAHEIVGHPCEADRALKMEAAYAGRSWLWRSGV